MASRFFRHSGIAPFPAQAIDVRNAVRFLRIHASEYGIDPEKMILSGDSSGGHTAMFAGLMHDDDSTDNLFPSVSAEVKGIVNYYGSVSVMLEDSNPTTINHKLPDSSEGLEMGGVNLRERLDLCKKFSVEENITKKTEIAPTLIFHGTKDRLVNTRQSVNLYKRMKENGKDVQLYLVKGGDHGGPEYWQEEILDIVDKYIQRCLGEKFILMVNDFKTAFQRQLVDCDLLHLILVGQQGLGLPQISTISSSYTSFAMISRFLTVPSITAISRVPRDTFWAMLVELSM